MAGIGLAVAVLTCCPAIARADGDPASDFLYTQPVFLTASASPAQRAELVQLADTSKRRGAPIKVAVITSAYDLGSITPLWAKPQRYAEFLGAELSYAYRGTLLVVMPNGFGIYRGGKPVAADLRAMKGLTTGPGVGRLVVSAAAAIRRLASAAGHPLPAGGGAMPASPTTATQPRRSHLFVVVVLVLGLVVIGAAWALSLRLRPVRSRRFTRFRLGFTRPVTLTGVLVATVPFAVAVGAVAAVALPLHGDGAATPRASRPGVVGLSWGAGARPAPMFTLTDQDGSPVSLGSLRGRVVMLAFVDPVCRNLCPLEASLLGQVERRFPPKSRPAVIAVSVNPWGNARSHLLEDIRNWQVGSGWRWAIGSHAALASVWRAYGIGVRARTVNAGGVAVHEISHSEQIYLIDRRGFERQVIPYPFTVPDVVRGVRRLETT